MAEVKPDKSDRKRVTLREVAQEAGVSLKTASNVINHSGRMADATREKVQDVIDRLGYRVNVSARNLNRGKTGFITLAVPSLTAPYLAELANRVIDAARIYGYSVYITTYAEGSAQGARALLRNFNATVSDGMILSISEVEDLDPERLARARAKARAASWGWTNCIARRSRRVSCEAWRISRSAHRRRSWAGVGVVIGWPSSSGSNSRCSHSRDWFDTQPRPVQRGAHSRRSRTPE